MSWSMPVVARSLEKKSRCPSGDSAGPASFLVVLIVGPRFTAVSQAPSVEERWATQRSKLSMHPVVDTRFPNPPGRSERKYRLSSSFDTVGVWSWHRELTGTSRCTGSDHSELAKDMAWIPRTRSLLVSVLQAASKARGISGKGRRASALVMGTSLTGG